jgi:peptide/nickel transport system substrate-binding protein
MMLYAIHDALVKPMPNNPEQLCLAESYAPSEDGRTHEFTLRDNAIFHSGEPVTAEDVKFSFQRYRGNSARFLQSKVDAVDIPDPRRVIFTSTPPGPIF